MTEKVTIRRQDDLPMPLIYLAQPSHLADWYVSQLAWTLEQGRRDLAISCFDTAGMGYPVSAAAQAVLKAVTDFLYEHPEAERLTILCAGETCFRAYTFHWNMWYAEHKPHHDN